MNRTIRLGDNVGIVFCSALVVALTGCTTYVDQPRARGGYYEEQPRPREVYVPPPPAQARVYEPPLAVEEESSYVGIRAESDFYEPLSPYGRWEVVGSYGRCWIPDRVDPEWRPYSNGYWQRTDAGWYWASDEPWAWATYHYGRWDLSPRFGWYWVPQTQWAPAWVSWHQGGGYVGWAPLHPSSRFGRSGAVEVNVTVISPRAYVIVEERRFLEPVRPATVIVNNTTIINKTVNITNIKVVNKTVINEGPHTTVIEQASGQKVQAVPVRELRRKQEAEVAATIRPTPPGREKKVQPPVRTEAEPRETKSAPAREPRRVETPAVTTTEPEAPAPKKHEAEATKPKAKPEAKHESQPEPKVKPEAKPEPERPAAIKEPAEAKVEKHADKTDKHGKGSEKKAMSESDRRAKEELAAAEQSKKNKAKKDRKKKVEEPQTPTETPPVPAPSSP